MARRPHEDSGDTRTGKAPALHGTGRALGVPRHCPGLVLPRAPHWSGRSVALVCVGWALQGPTGHWDQHGTGTSTTTGPAPHTRDAAPPPRRGAPGAGGGLGGPPRPPQGPQAAMPRGRGGVGACHTGDSSPPPRPPPPAVSHGPAMLREVGGLPSASQCLPVSLCSPLLYPCSPPVVPLLLALLPVQPPQNHHGSPSTDPPVQPPRPVQLPLVQQHPTQYSTHPSTTRSQYSPPSTAPTPVQPHQYTPSPSHYSSPETLRPAPALAGRGGGPSRVGVPMGWRVLVGQWVPIEAMCPHPWGGPVQDPFPPPHPVPTHSCAESSLRPSGCSGRPSVPPLPK